MSHSVGLSVSGTFLHFGWWGLLSFLRSVWTCSPNTVQSFLSPGTPCGHHFAYFELAFEALSRLSNAVTWGPFISRADKVLGEDLSVKDIKYCISVSQITETGQFWNLGPSCYFQKSRKCSSRNKKYKNCKRAFVLLCGWEPPWWFHHFSALVLGFPTWFFPGAFWGNWETQMSVIIDLPPLAGGVW